MAVRPTSLRARMAATALLVSTLTAALLVVGVQVVLARSNDAAVQSRLDAKVSAAAATVVAGPRGIRILEQKSPLLDQNVWIFDTHGHLVDGRLPQPQLERIVESLAGATDHREKTVADVTYLALPVRRSGSQVATVVAAEDHDPYERAERNSVWLSILLGLATVVHRYRRRLGGRHPLLRQVQAMADLADDWREHDTGPDSTPGRVTTRSPTWAARST